MIRIVKLLYIKSFYASWLIWVLYFLFYSTAPVNAQHHLISNLSQHTNYHVSLDSKQLVWVSSIEGINIYNGNNVRVLKPGPYNLKGTNIQSAFFEDQNSNIWFSTYQALHVYDRQLDNFRIFQMEDSLGSIQEDYKVIYLQDSLLYFRAGKEFFVFNTISEKLISRLNQNLSEYINESVILNGSELSIAFAHPEKSIILKLNSENLHEIDTIYKLSEATIDVIEFSQKFIFTTTNDKIFGFDPEQMIKIKLGLNAKNIRYISNYQDSVLYILSNNRIIVSPLGKLTENVKCQTLASGTNPFKIFTDSKDDIFYSVDGKGVFHFSKIKSKFEHLKLKQNDLNVNACSLHEDNNNIWFTSRVSGVGKLDERGNLISAYNRQNNNCPSDFVFNLCSTKFGLLGVGGSNVLKYNNKSDEFNNLTIVNQGNRFFYSIQSIKDKILVISNDSNGLYELREFKDKIFMLNQINFTHPIKSKILSIHEFGENHVLADLNYNSIGYFNWQNDRLNLEKKIEINSSIKSFWEMENGELYISTNTGLFFFPQGILGTFTKLHDQDELLNQSIYSVLGHKEFLYLSSNKGLLRYNTLDSTVHQFTLADGIQGMEYNTTAGLKTKDGRFLFGGTNGINVFHPDSIKFLDYNTPIHLSNILVNDDEYDWEYNISLEDTIKFDYENNTLTFKFHGIDYSDPEAVELKYIMENYDKEWVNIEKNDGSVRYANLPPGHYTFKMQATNSDKIWSNIVREIDVTITPPFWQTWWFRILSFLALSSITWWLVNSFYKRKLEKKDLELREQRLQFDKQKALQDERNRIAAEMHDDLGGGLTSIKFLAHRALKNKADKNPNEIIEKIIHHSADLINNMSEIIWAMNSGYDTLPNLIAYIRNYLKKQTNEFELDLEVSVQKGIKEVEFSGQKRRNIFLVIKEAFHNTVKYAEADRIKFEVKIENNNLIIKYLDNGIGFNEKEIVSGNGLKNMKRRVEEINGNWTLKSDNGVELTMIFPMKKAL